jgi:hypothetical protein
MDDIDLILEGMERELEEQETEIRALGKRLAAGAATVADVSTLMFRVHVPLRTHHSLEPFGIVGAGLARATGSRRRRKPSSAQTRRPQSSSEAAPYSRSRTEWACAAV